VPVCWFAARPSVNLQDSHVMTVSSGSAAVTGVNLPDSHGMTVSSGSGAENGHSRVRLAPWYEFVLFATVSAV
jgi:hypothetical protein